MALKYKRQNKGKKPREHGSHSQDSSQQHVTNVKQDMKRACKIFIYGCLIEGKVAMDDIDVIIQKN